MPTCCFHRLVVRAPHLGWEEPVGLAAGAIEARFVTKVVGELVEPTEQVRLAEDHYAIVGGGGGQIEHEGRFIEIVVPGTSPEHAEMCAHAVLGFLGLCVGDHAIGRVVFSEAYLGHRGTDATAVTLATTHSIPSFVGEHEREALHGGFSAVGAALADERSALTLALRWYEHGVRAATALDRVLSFFIGVEAIVKAHAKRVKLRSALAPLAEDALFRELLSRYARAEDPAAQNRLVANLVQPTNAERFVAYAERHGLDQASIDVFRRLSGLRNPTVHGDFAVATEEDAEDARGLLRTLLKAEIGLSARLAADLFPARLRQKIEWREETGWVMSPHVDWEKRLGMTVDGPAWN